MALENVMRVDGGNIIGGGSGASKNFQGTIEEWNALTTEEKKAYDHASIPDSIDGGVTFPANKVVMTGGGNVEDAVDEKPKVLTTEVSFVVNTSTGLVISRLLNIPYAKVLSLTQAYNDDTYNILAIDHVTGHRISLANNNGLGEVVLLGPDGGWSNLSRQWTILVKVAYLE